MGASPAKPRRTPGRNKTYHLSPDCTLLRNAESVDPRLDGWWRDGPAERMMGVRYTCLSESVALRALRASHQLGTLEVVS